MSFGNYRVFLPGDLQKLAMGEFLNKKTSIRNSYAESIRTELANGVDFLICPHHGLKSSFSVVSTQFRASPFERALFSALNRVLLIN